MGTFIIILLVIVAALIVYYLVFSNRMAGQSILSEVGNFFGQYEDTYLGSKQRKFDLLLQDPWFDMVESGKKTLEARVGPADKWQDIVGKVIKCKNKDGRKTFVKVITKRHYKTLDEVLDKEKIDQLCPGSKSKAAAKEALMGIKNKAGEAVYDPSKVTNAGGIVVFELKVASN